MSSLTAYFTNTHTLRRRRSQPPERASLQAAVGIAVALMRFHQGSLTRQATLSAALVESMGCSTHADGIDKSGASHTASATLLSSSDKREAQEEEHQERPFLTPAFGGDDHPPSRSPTSEGQQQQQQQQDVETAEDHDMSLPNSAAGRGEGEGGSKSREPLVDDPWFQLVLCRECMLHGFHRAAEAGLRRLREGVEEGGAGATGDCVWAWTEVLVKVAMSEAFYGDTADQVWCGWCKLCCLWYVLCPFFRGSGVSCVGNFRAWQIKQ